MPLKTLLRGLFDLSGVEVAFFTDLQGNCLTREGAYACSDDALGDLGRRLLNVLQSHETSLAEATEVYLCFSQKNIYARRSSDHLLGLICLPTTDLTSLRVGTRLALRQFESLPRAVALSAKTTAVATVSPAETSPPPPTPAEVASFPEAPSHPFPVATPVPSAGIAANASPAPPVKPKKKTRLGIWD